VGSKLNGERIPTVRGPKQKLRREGSRKNNLGREVEVVEAPSRMIAELYCFLAGSHPVCFGPRYASIQHYEIYVYTSEMTGF